MSITINAPKAAVTTYDVANQTDVQFNFDFDPTQFRADGTTLVLEYEGQEIRLENFFDAEGNTNVENFLTSDGTAFSASDFLATIMDTEGTESAEDLETAAGADGGSSGAGAYDDDAGSLFAGLDAMGDQPDAYASVERERPEEVTGFTVDGGEEIIFPTGEKWGEYDPYDYYNSDTGTFDLPDSIMDKLSATGMADFTVSVEYKGSADVNGADADYDIYEDANVDLYGRFRHMDPDGDFVGTDGVDTLVLEDVGTDTPFGTAYTGYALRLEDDFSFAEAGPHVQNIEVIDASEGSDIIDLSSANYTYGDVTVYGDGGNDVIWANAGNDTLYGGEGNDYIIGGTGNDQIFGEEGNDILHGGQGADLLVGGAGDDTISSGTGWGDEITLGDGNDVVVINGMSVTDGLLEADGGSMVTINDFNYADDSIELAAGYTVLDYDYSADYNGDGQNDLIMLVGDSIASNNTYIIFDDVDSATAQQILSSEFGI